MPDPTTDTTLRHRVAEAMRTTRREGYEGAAKHGEHRYDARCALCAADVDALTAAVLAVLPAPVDPATVLLWAAERVTAHAADHFPTEYDQYADALADMLRRLAGGTANNNTETREETGAALARLIADRPVSEIQAAIRILGWPPLRFEVVDDEHSCAASGCSGEPEPWDVPDARPGTTDHTRTQSVVPCSAVALRKAHVPHGWQPQPGMDFVHCPGASGWECPLDAEPAAGAGQDGAEAGRG